MIDPTPPPPSPVATIAPWQRLLRDGDHLVVAARSRGRRVFVWVEVLDTAASETHVRALRRDRRRPDGVVEDVPRASAVFPLSSAQFDAARRTGWPRTLRAVQAIACLVPGGEG